MNCIYCEKRCNVCLKPCLNYRKCVFPNLGAVQTCSKFCSDVLFHSEHCDLQNMKDSSQHFAPNGHMELIRFYHTYKSVSNPGLNTVLVISVCQRKGDDDQFAIPSNMKYIKFWQRDIAKPYCVEYFIDEQFRPVEMLKFEGSTSVFSAGEEKEMIHQFHQTVVQTGLPYHIAQLEFCTSTP